LWSVDDAYTQILMQYFTDELFVEHDFFPATNLRYAILKLKEENPNPYVWAAFVSMGMPYPSKVKLEVE
jgi:CHAT domain-containing protein